MRPIDLEMSDSVWFYTPPNHKTQHRGHSRVIPIGPKGQAILRPFLDRPVDAYLFSPAEAEAEIRAKRHAARKTPLSCGNRPGTNRKANPQWKPGDRYTRDTYYRAVQHAIRAARKAGIDVPDFHPHQLRHTAATEVRRALGRDAARALLGHRTLTILDHYAEIDEALAVQAAKRMG